MILMVALKYADVKKFGKGTYIFPVHKYKVFWLDYIHVKFQDSIVSQSKVTAAGKYDLGPWGVGT